MRTITEGSDWLTHPDVIRLREMHGLGDVKTQIVGPRASFEGKAYGYQGLIRMPSNARHPTLWLLTYLHELAHVMDDRGRLQLFEEHHGRRARQGASDSRWLHRIDAPHGQRWTEAFTRLAYTAAELGLFPGNEAKVLAHARSGRARTSRLSLDLDADPRVQTGDFCLDSEPVGAHVPPFFACGDAVCFDTGERRHGRLHGKVVRVNRKTCTVETKEGRWRVSFCLLQRR